MAEFSQRAVIITGAASGIGRAVALAFAAQQAIVGLVDRDAEGLKAVAARVEERGGAAAIAPGELSTEASITNALDRLSFSRVDILVNNAGIDLASSLVETKESDLDRILTVNLKVPFLFCKQVVSFMPTDGTACIVNVSSASGLLPMAGRPAYNASKGALIALTRSLALDLAPAIRVNCICPGAIDTPLLHSSLPAGPETAQKLEAVKQRYPLQRLGEAEEIAQAVMFLTSAESRYITGISLAVDGGRSLH